MGRFMGKIFHYQERVELHHIDGAGILFFGQLFFLVHNAFAAFLRENHCSIKDRLDKKDFFFPVVHADADYLNPIRLDDELDIQLTVNKIGTSSFSIACDILVKGKKMATAHVIHAVIDTSHFQKLELPPSFKATLAEYHL